MVTGDNAITAKAIAEDCGIISPEKIKAGYDVDATVYEGKTFWETIGGLKQTPKLDDNGDEITDKFGKTI